MSWSGDGINYTIAAIPTMYRGRQYRSRLEARWAAFFDLLKWQPEYEPVDLGKWSPDFTIRIDGRAWLVEVKPIESFGAAIGERMILAADPLSGIEGLLLVGVCPIPTPGVCSPVLIGYSNPVQNGVFAGWRDSYLLFIAARRTPTFYALIGRADNCELPGVRAYPAHVMSVWAEATNLVQWAGSSK